MYPAWRLEDICDALGYSRQGYYKHLKAEAKAGLEAAIVVKLVAALRDQMPRLGGKKLYFLLQRQLVDHQIQMGRDRFFALLSSYGLLVRRRKKRKPLTTDSDHPFFKYPNLIRELVPVRANELWVSDITYIPAGTGFCYLSLITDAYSRKIVGWCLWQNLKRDGTLQALDMALETLPGARHRQRLIHHSDRGLQYCSKDYIDRLAKNSIYISMTEQGDPYENAIAERVNGILKSEFLLDRRFGSYEEALQITTAVIATYNGKRPHASCNYLTPEMAHLQTGHLERRWKAKGKQQQKQPLLLSS